MSHSQFHCTGRVYLDLHGLIFETSICYWQDQPGSQGPAQAAAGRACLPACASAGGLEGRRGALARPPAPRREAVCAGGRHTFAGGQEKPCASRRDPCRLRLLCSRAQGWRRGSVAGRLRQTGRLGLAVRHRRQRGEGGQEPRSVPLGQGGEPARRRNRTTWAVAGGGPSVGGSRKPVGRWEQRQRQSSSSSSRAAAAAEEDRSRGGGPQQRRRRRGGRHQRAALPTQEDPPGLGPGLRTLLRADRGGPAGRMRGAGRTASSNRRWSSGAWTRATDPPSADHGGLLVG